MVEDTEKYFYVFFICNNFFCFYLIRCRNSIGILTRQEKAAKLNTCICDGREDYDCKQIHHNMNALCFNRLHHEYHDVTRLEADIRTNGVNRNGERSRASGLQCLVNRTTIIFTLVLLLLTSKGKYPSQSISILHRLRIHYF